MGSYSSSYADFVQGLTYDQLRPPIVLQTKKLILDFVGVALAGQRLMEFPRLVVDYLEGLGGTPEATLVGRRKRVPAVHAAFGNGACGHALDMDDGHRYGALHPGTVIIHRSRRVSYRKPIPRR